MNEFLSKHKKLPVVLSMMPALEGQGSDEKKSVLLGRIKYYRQVPKQMLGLIVNKKGQKKGTVYSGESGLPYQCWIRLAVN